MITAFILFSHFIVIHQIWMPHGRSFDKYMNKHLNVPPTNDIYCMSVHPGSGVPPLLLFEGIRTKGVVAAQTVKPTDATFTSDIRLC